MIAFEMKSGNNDRNTATRAYAERGTPVGMALIMLIVMMLGGLSRLLIVNTPIRTR